MKITITKEELNKGINIVDRATSVKALQPVLLNILIETVGAKSIKLCATDLDMTVTVQVDAQVKTEGKITVPSKTLKEIVTKLSDGALVNIDVTDTLVNITSGSSKFEVYGIAASEFPVDTTNPKDGIEIELKPFVKAVKHAGFAAAAFESSNLLSGIVFAIEDGMLEIASTDGNRLARYKQKLDATAKDCRLIIPAKALNEFEKISSFIEEKFVTLYQEGSKVVIKSEKTIIISRLLEGQFPKYNQLIPADSPKIAIAEKSRMMSALERVAIMVNEKTNIVTMDFSANKLMLCANTPDAGKSEETLEIDYAGDDLSIAFNYKYVLDALKNLDSSDVKIGLNTSLSATVLRPSSDEDMICLIMPVQVRG
jgi:DNA polymerase-3 subunit beta